MIFLAVISVNTAYTVLIPLVPQIERRAGLTETGISLVFAIFAGARAVTQPLGGLLTDRWSAGWVSLLAVLVVAVCVCLLAAARTPAAILAARAGWGVGEGLLTPALYQGTTNLCARYDIPVNRAMAWFGTSAVVGLMLGPAFAGLAAGLGLSWLCIACAAISVVTGLGAYAAQRGPSKAAARTPATAPAPAPAGAAPAGAPFLRAWLITVLLFGVLDLLTNLAYSGLEPTIPLYLTPADPRRISAVFMLGTGTFAVTSWLLGRWHNNGPGPATLIVLGCLTGVLGFAGFSFANTIWDVAPSMVVVMISNPMLYLAARWGTARLRESGGPAGLAFGIFGAVSDVGYMLGPLVSVALISAVGPSGFTFVGLIGALGLLTAWPVAHLRNRTREVTWLPP